MLHYYRILGLNSSASLSDVKKAYRKKAKEFHPDVNPSPQAEEQFILVNEAYEYLLNLKSGKVYNEKRANYRKPERPVKTRAQWQQEQREAARERARRHARMKYEAFKKTNYYKNEVALDIIWAHLAILFLVLFYVTVPAIGIIYGIWEVLAAGIIMNLILLPLWNILKVKERFKPKLFFISVKRILKTRLFKVLLLAFINVALFIKYPMNTFASFSYMLGIFIFSCILGFYFVKYGKWVINDAYRRSLFAYGFFPLAFNLFFAFNYWFSGPVYQETYTFKPKMVKVGRHGTRKAPSPEIILADNKYDDYFAVRFFWSYQYIGNNRTITYTLADGFFGFKARKDWEIY